MLSWVFTIAGLICLACSVGCGGCSGEPFPIDGMPPIDGRQVGTVSLSWSLVDLTGAPITCEQVGATTVFLQLRSHNSASGVGVSLSCDLTPNTSQPLPPDTYDVTFELHAGTTVLATATEQDSIVVRAGADTPLKQVTFQVDARGTLAISLFAPPFASNCVGGAGIADMSITLVHSDDGCASSGTSVVAFTRSSGAAPYPINCSLPMLVKCIENTDVLTAASIPSGPYNIHVIGKINGLDCWTNDDSLQVPPKGGTLNAKLNLALHTEIAGCKSP